MILQDPQDDRQANCNILNYSCHRILYLFTLNLPRQGNGTISWAIARSANDEKFPQTRKANEL